MKNIDLDILEYNSYYQAYIDKTEGLSLIEGMMQSHKKTYEFLSSIPEDRLDYRYDEGKWTIKEIIQHLLDSERVFAYRALRIAREDKTPLAGFEQDDYILPSLANQRSMSSFLAEYDAVRTSTDLLFKSFSSNALTKTGVASNSDVSVRALGFIIMGHEKHHCEIIRERYL